LVKKCITSGCVIIRNERALLLKHKKLNKWLYPGGHVDEGETPVEAALREAKEETGYNVRIIAKKRLGLQKRHSIEQPVPICILYENVYYRTGRHMHFDMVYLAKPIGRQGRVAKGESDSLRWVREQEIGDLDTYENVKSTLKYAFKAAKHGIMFNNPVW